LTPGILGPSSPTKLEKNLKLKLSVYWLCVCHKFLRLFFITARSFACISWGNASQPFHAFFLLNRQLFAPIAFAFVFASPFADDRIESFHCHGHSIRTFFDESQCRFFAIKSRVAYSIDNRILKHDGCLLTV